MSFKFAFMFSFSLGFVFSKGEAVISVFYTLIIISSKGDESMLPFSHKY